MLEMCNDCSTIQLLFYYLRSVNYSNDLPKISCQTTWSNITYLTRNNLVSIVVIVRSLLCFRLRSLFAMAWNFATSPFLYFFYYSKEFDSICHDVVLAKLRALGCRDETLSWIWSYLEGRTQAFIKNGWVSSLWLHAMTGVP